MQDNYYVINYAVGCQVNDMHKGSYEHVHKQTNK